MTLSRRLELAAVGVHRSHETVAVAPSEDVLDIEFDDTYGLAEGQPVLIWTEQHVYFPVVYDGAEWLGSAPRNPTREGQSHVGGE